VSRLVNVGSAGGTASPEKKRLPALSVGEKWGGSWALGRRMAGFRRCYVTGEKLGSKKFAEMFGNLSGFARWRAKMSRKSAESRLSPPKNACHKTVLTA
jgi:hypothetical protein